MIQTLLSVSLSCAPCTGAVRVKTEVMKYYVAAEKTEFQLAAYTGYKSFSKVGKGICNHFNLNLCKFQAKQVLHIEKCFSFLPKGRHGLHGSNGLHCLLWPAANG